MEESLLTEPVMTPEHDATSTRSCALPSSPHVHPRFRRPFVPLIRPSLLFPFPFFMNATKRPTERTTIYLDAVVNSPTLL